MTLTHILRSRKEKNPKDEIIRNSLVGIEIRMFMRQKKLPSILPIKDSNFIEINNIRNHL
jgi:hypothetical protein